MRNANNPISLLTLACGLSLLALSLGACNYTAALEETRYSSNNDTADLPDPDQDSAGDLGAPDLSGDTGDAADLTQDMEPPEDLTEDLPQDTTDLPQDSEDMDEEEVGEDMPDLLDDLPDLPEDVVEDTPDTEEDLPPDAEDDLSDLPPEDLPDVEEDLPPDMEEDMGPGDPCLEPVHDPLCDLAGYFPFRAGMIQDNEGRGGFLAELVDLPAAVSVRGENADTYLSFNGTGYMRVSNIGTILPSSVEASQGQAPITEPFTLVLQVARDANGSDLMGLVSALYNQVGWAVHLQDNRLELELNPGGSPLLLGSPMPLPLDASFHQIAISFDGEQRLTLSVDGRPEIQARVPWLALPVDRPLGIGVRAFTSQDNVQWTAHTPFLGKLASVQIWRRALSRDELISMLPQQTTGLPLFCAPQMHDGGDGESCVPRESCLPGYVQAGLNRCLPEDANLLRHYPLDQITPVQGVPFSYTSPDELNPARPLELTQAVLEETRFGDAANFTAINAPATVSAEGLPDGDDVRAISLHFRLDETQTHSSVLFSYGDVDAQHGVKLKLQPDGPNTAILYLLGQTPTDDEVNAPQTNLTLARDTWHHLVYQVNGHQEQEIYLNGARVLIHDTPPETTISAGGVFTLGGEGDISFAGALDEVRIYNRSLSLTEMDELRLNNLLEQSCLPGHIPGGAGCRLDGACSQGFYPGAPLSGAGMPLGTCNPRVGEQLFCPIDLAPREELRVCTLPPNNVPATPLAHCKAWKDVGYKRPGVYLIQPAEAEEPFEVWCGSNNKDWQLAMRIDGQGSRMYFGDSAWTSAGGLDDPWEVYQRGSLVLAPHEQVPFGKIRLVVEYPAGSGYTWEKEFDPMFASTDSGVDPEILREVFQASDGVISTNFSRVSLPWVNNLKILNGDDSDACQTPEFNRREVPNTRLGIFQDGGCFANAPDALFYAGLGLSALGELAPDFPVPPAGVVMGTPPHLVSLEPVIQVYIKQ